MDKTKSWYELIIYYPGNDNGWIVYCGNDWVEGLWAFHQHQTHLPEGYTMDFVAHYPNIGKTHHQKYPYLQE